MTPEELDALGPFDWDTPRSPRPILPRCTQRAPRSHYTEHKPVRLRIKTSQLREGAERRRGVTQTALDVGPAVTDSKVYTVERGEKYSSWIRPSSAITYLDMLELPRQWNRNLQAFGFPRNRTADVLAALEADGRAVVLIEVTGR